jgi:hypothetical protein
MMTTAVEASNKDLIQSVYIHKAGGYVSERYMTRPIIASKRFHKAMILLEILENHSQDHSLPIVLVNNQVSVM